MDPSRFARLVRSLARPTSRRATLATLLGSAVAGALDRTAAAQLKHAAPAKKQAHPAQPAPTPDNAGPNEASGDRKRCPSGKKPCHGRCLPKHRHCHKSGQTCTDNGQPCQQASQCCTNECANGVCAPRLGCAENGTACQQNSDCCTGNCFGQVCAGKPPTCRGQNCPGGATGCCPNDGCCQPPANQCNVTSSLCCAPNCNGRQCGPDGCGNGGTCGSCPTGQTCNQQNGKCQGQPTCSPATCPNGCCDKRGTCQPGNTEQACGAGGQACVNCPGSKSTCHSGQCVCTPQCQGKQCGPDGCGGLCGTCPTDKTCNVITGQCQQATCAQTCLSGCCDASGACQSGVSPTACGSGGSTCVTCGALATCRAGECCIAEAGMAFTPCSVQNPCCSPLVCGNGGEDGNVCCFPSRAACNTGNPGSPDPCCFGGCEQFDSGCTSNCPGQCTQ